MSSITIVSNYGEGNYSDYGYGNCYEFFEYWLTDDYYWDLNEDGIVNFIDWTILKGV